MSEGALQDIKNYSCLKSEEALEEDEAEEETLEPRKKTRHSIYCFTQYFLT